MNEQIVKNSEQNRSWAKDMADSVIKRAVPFKWHYEYGLVLKAIEQVGLKTGDERYFNHIQREISPFIQADGSILTYTVPEFNLDQVTPGRLLFPLLHHSTEDRYQKALRVLRSQLTWQPRTRGGGFWHKLIYPHQMWLDGIYMAAPFYAEYAKTFGEMDVFTDIVHQITLIEEHTCDPHSGLLYHGWDESRLQRWANPATGCSPHFWDRAMGWYVMGIVEVLDYLPKDHAGRSKIIDILNRALNAAFKVQDPDTGLWYQVMDQGKRAGNYLEASGSCMFVYSAAKAVRMGYVPGEMLEPARRGYYGILDHLIRVDADGMVNLEQVCSVAGLGGTPYRDGSYEYYVSEKVHANDYKGVGPFILAALEMEMR